MSDVKISFYLDINPNPIATISSSLENIDSAIIEIPQMVVHEIGLSYALNVTPVLHMTVEVDEPQLICID